MEYEMETRVILGSKGRVTGLQVYRYTFKSRNHMRGPNRMQEG